MIVILIPIAAYGEPATFVDGVSYIQYTDDGVALADIAAERLDLYYGGLDPELVDSDNDSIRIYESKSGS